ncbi:ribulokinase [Roseivivax halodurans JCM 10272]|uniref:Ribulokinase n=1 Tax=Roseivivax halodurans JCM 10272 TaxID=1449350 RepID=X7EDC5_9RHOB|nr:FGGY-family carbohydrate kinase [Roseivivax halodurans]ETX13206.1 ribulokinase [Roseivivax halodurans JCM 10272]
MGGKRYTIGIDVGTGSARAGVFDSAGAQHGAHSAEIGTHRAPGGIVEQSSADIWSACSTAVRGAVSAAGIAPGDVAGLGFDATCSLVVLGDGGAPLPVGDTTARERDVIVWMDHRATDQAARINACDHDVLKYVGGRISPEMQTPKLLWLRENRPDVFNGAWQFFDLTDFLGWRATGATARSSCTVTCKWTYLAHEDRWDPYYFRAIGLGVLADEGFARIGTDIVRPGTPLGAGLTPEAADELGLAPGTAVGAGLIDAHAGGIGTVGPEEGPEANLAYVFGTSSCTMTSTAEPVFVPGVWGPYFEAMVPGLWLNEGGQSVAGAAIAHLVRHHPYATAATQDAEASGMSLPNWLADMAAKRADGASAVVLADGVHVVPEFLGNRAPFADPDTRAVILGLGMDDGVEGLVALYVAGVCGIGYGLRQIIEAQATRGIRIRRVVLSGGAGRHPVVRQLLAGSAGIEIAIPAAEEPVLLGAAILGSVASGEHADIRHAMSEMTRFSDRFEPPADAASAHANRFEIFENMQALARDAKKERRFPCKG